MRLNKLSILLLSLLIGYVSCNKYGGEDDVPAPPPKKNTDPNKGKFPVTYQGDTVHISDKYKKLFYAPFSNGNIESILIQYPHLFLHSNTAFENQSYTYVERDKIAAELFREIRKAIGKAKYKAILMKKSHGGGTRTSYDELKKDINAGYNYGPITESNSKLLKELNPDRF